MSLLNNDHRKPIPGLFLPYFLMMTDFQDNAGISNYGGGVLRGGAHLVSMIIVVKA